MQVLREPDWFYMSSIILALRDLVLVAILMSGGAIVCMHACKHALAAATYLHAPGPVASQFCIQDLAYG